MQATEGLLSVCKREERMANTESFLPCSELQVNNSFNVGCFRLLAVVSLITIHPAIYSLDDIYFGKPSLSPGPSVD